MTRAPSLFTIALLTMLLGAEASALVWTVDPSAPGASDERRPGETGPLRTIGRAAELAAPGDIVQVRAGIYRETVLLPRSGSPDAPIRFVAQPPGSAIITGADPLKGLSRVSGPEPIYEAHWPHRFVAGRDRSGAVVEHHPAGEPLWGRAEQVVAEGQLLLPATDLAALRQAWRDRDAALRPAVPGLGGPFGGMFAVDGISKRLYVWLVDGADPTKLMIEASRRAVLVDIHPARRGRPVTDVSFEGFVFRYAANFPQRPAILLEGARNMLSDCVVEYMNSVGLSVHGTLRDCHIRHNGHVGGSAEGTGFLNERTTWEGNSWKPIPRDWEAGGVKITQDGPGEFRDCTFLRNGGPGLWFDIDAHDIVVRRSRFVENEGSGVFIEISRDISVVDSTMSGNAGDTIGGPKGNRWGSGGISIAESLRAKIQRNIVRGNLDGLTLREQGPRLTDRQEGAPISYRNADHDISDNEIAGNIRYQLAFWWDNVFFGPHPSVPTKAEETAFDPMRQGMSIDRNVYRAPPGSVPFLYGAPWRPAARRFHDLSAFSRATGFERRGSLVFR